MRDYLNHKSMWQLQDRRMTRVDRPNKRTKKRNRVGSNQYRTRKRQDGLKWIALYLGLFGCLLYGGYLKKSHFPPTVEARSVFISPLADSGTASESATLHLRTEMPSATPAPVAEGVKVSPTPSELEEIVAYIARKFEPEGKHIVIRAINCFYSESGLRKDAVGQNSDGPRSRDHGVAQLNDYWHKLTEAEKTEIKANIDRAYKIYKGRGGNFSAWYGKLCN